MPEPSTIAIDGPNASGKSVVGERLAGVLGYLYFDTGAMYRAVAWLAIQRGTDLNDPAALGELAASAHIDVQPASYGEEGRHYTVTVDGEDVTLALRSPEVERVVSPAVSANPAVRRVLVEQQRRIARRGRVVMVGRDIGTVVLPEADLKIYLDAEVETRVRRRHGELLERGTVRDYETVLADLQRRDKADRERKESPLRQAEDAIRLDTTNLAVDEVVAKILEWVRADP